MDTDGPKRGRGRPRDPAKRASLLSAARGLFLRQGPDGVTIDEVIAYAKVSRATFYSNFADKHELLAAVIAAESQRIVTEEWMDAHETVDLDEKLTAFGDNLLLLIGEPDTMRMELLIMLVTQSRPEVGVTFFAAGPGRVRAMLARIIAAGQGRGELREANAEKAANDLIGLWQGMWRTEVIYGHRATLSEPELKQLSRSGVTSFLNLYRPNK